MFEGENVVVNTDSETENTSTSGAYNLGKYFTNGISSAGKSLGGGIYNLGSSVLGGVYNAGSYLVSGAYNKGSYIVGGVYNAGSSIVGGAYNKGSSLVGSAYNAGSFIVGGLYTVATALINGAYQIVSANVDPESQETTDPLVKEMREHVQEQEAINSKQVDDLVESSGSILQVFLLTAPKEVQDAVKGLTQNKEVMELLQGNEPLVTLLGSENIEQGLLQLTAGNTEDTVVTLSQEDQIAVLEMLSDLLNRNEHIKTEDVLLARQFFETLVKGIKELQQGKKQYATFVTEVNGYAKVIHASLDDLLNKPNTIGYIYSTFLEQGATAGIQMSFTSPEQAAAISFIMNNVQVNTLTDRMSSLTQEELHRLNFKNRNSALTKPGIKSLSDIVALIAYSDENVDILARVLGTTAPELQQQLNLIIKELRTNSSNTPIPGFTNAQVFALMKKMATMILTGLHVTNSLKLNQGPIGAFVSSDAFSKNSVEGNTVTIINSALQNEPQKQELLLGLAPKSIQLSEEPVVITPPKDEDSSIVVLPVQPPIIDLVVENPDVLDFDNVVIKKPKDKLDLSEQWTKYLMLVEQFNVISLDLNERKKSNKKYEKVAQVAIDLHKKLENAAVFFENPTPENFKVFNEFCKNSIKEAEGEFKQHREIWHSIHPIIKAILGVLAALTIIPAIVVICATKQGYKGTFFSTPETASAQKLGKIESDIENLASEIDQKIRPK